MKCFILNIPKETTKEALRAHFSRFGEVANVTIFFPTAVISFTFDASATLAKQHADNSLFLGQVIQVKIAADAATTPSSNNQATTTTTTATPPITPPSTPPVPLIVSFTFGSEFFFKFLSCKKKKQIVQMCQDTHTEWLDAENNTNWQFAGDSSDVIVEQLEQWESNFVTIPIPENAIQAMSALCSNSDLLVVDSILVGFEEEVEKFRAIIDKFKVEEPEEPEQQCSDEVAPDDDDLSTLPDIERSKPCKLKLRFSMMLPFKNKFAAAVALLQKQHSDTNISIPYIKGGHVLEVLLTSSNQASLNVVKQKLHLVFRHKEHRLPYGVQIELVRKNKQLLIDFLNTKYGGNIRAFMPRNFNDVILVTIDDPRLEQAALETNAFIQSKILMVYVIPTKSAPDSNSDDDEETVPKSKTIFSLPNRDAFVPAYIGIAKRVQNEMKNARVFVSTKGTSVVFSITAPNPQHVVTRIKELNQIVEYDLGYKEDEVALILQNKLVLIEKAQQLLKHFGQIALCFQKDCILLVGPKDVVSKAAAVVKNVVAEQLVSHRAIKLSTHIYEILKMNLLHGVQPLPNVKLSIEKHNTNAKLVGTNQAINAALSIMQSPSFIGNVQFTLQCKDNLSFEFWVSQRLPKLRDTVAGTAIYMTFQVLHQNVALVTLQCLLPQMSDAYSYKSLWLEQAKQTVTRAAALQGVVDEQLVQKCAIDFEKKYTNIFISVDFKARLVHVRGFDTDLVNEVLKQILQASPQQCILQ